MQEVQHSGRGSTCGVGSMMHLINCSYGNKMMLSNRVIRHIPLQPQRLHHKCLPLAAEGVRQAEVGWAGRVGGAGRMGGTGRGGWGRQSGWSSLRWVGRSEVDCAGEGSHTFLRRCTLTRMCVIHTPSCTEREGKDDSATGH